MNKSFLIINANYYRDISSGLLKSAISLIPKRCKIKIINVPGALEIAPSIKFFSEKPSQNNFKLLQNTLQIYSRYSKGITNSRSTRP